MNIPKECPWYPVELTSKYARICQAMRDGEASGEDQKEFMSWLLNHVCAIGDLEFRPDSDRASTFASGKRFVGMQVKKHLMAKPGVLEQRENKGEQ